MSGLKDNAYTGDSKKRNPYEGDLDKGIAYDKYEANFPVIVQAGNFPEISTTYRQAARELVQYSSARNGQTVLDLGSGTGISTLELLQQKQGIYVVGVEMSEGMLLVAKYKFHQNNGEELLAQVTDEKLLQYWWDFRKESRNYRYKAEFLQGDFQEVQNIAPESIYSAIGSQFMHWTDLSKSFKQLNRFLRTKGEVVWSSASHFYNDAQFPAAKFGFRYNDFLACVLDDVCHEGGFAANDYHSLSKPSYNLESVKAITLEQGFETEQIATHLREVDLQVFVQNHVPVFVRQLVGTSKTEQERLEEMIKKAVGRAIVNPKALQDTTHKYDVIPIFRSVKR
ncbi:MAG: class I SAM-dependent methyltransferase [Nanoarchaeota archaeon]